jgi:diguanylate cyclase (GGDEF)-like protein/PAS domain S-box-containing protein
MIRSDYACGTVTTPKDAKSPPLLSSFTSEVRLSPMTNEPRNRTEPSAQRSAEDRALLAHTRGSALVSILLDSELRLQWADEGIFGLTGYQPEEVVGFSALEFVHPDDLPALAAAVAPELAAETSFSRYEPMLPTLSIQCRVRTKAGRWLVVELFRFNYLDDPAITGVLITIRDATIDAALAAATDALARGGDTVEVTNFIRAAFAALDRSEAFVVLDPIFPNVVGDGFPFADDAIANGPWMDTLMTGAPTIVQVTDLVGHDDLVAYANRRGYRAMWVYAITEPSSGRVRGCLTVLSSLTGWPRLLPKTMLERSAQLLSLALERDHYTNRLRHAAFVDALTGVLSRTRLFADLERAVTVGPVTVLYVDLDGFKQVNDVYGHAVGDNLLRAAAERIRAAVRPGDIVGRLGGDEFAIVCTQRMDRGDALAVAARVVESFHRPVSVNDVAQEVTVSVGIAFGTQFMAHGDLLAQADAAMYRAKQAGKNRWSV